MHVGWRRKGQMENSKKKTRLVFMDNLFRLVISTPESGINHKQTTSR